MTPEALDKGFAHLKNFPTTGRAARPAASFRKFLLPGFEGPPLPNLALPPSCKCSCPAMPPSAFFTGGRVW